MVSIVLFALGSVFAVFEGVEKILHPHTLESTGWALAILGVAVLLESLSFRTAVRESNPQRQGASWAQFIHTAKAPELPVLLLEDSGALVGLVIAFSALGLATLTGNSVGRARLGAHRPAARRHRHRAAGRDEEPAHRRVGHRADQQAIRSAITGSRRYAS